MPMEDCLNNLLAQFDKLYPWSLKKSTSEDQTERKSDKFETPPGIKKKKNQDSETQKSPENETSRHIKNAYEISRPGQNFARPTFFEVPFYTPIMWSLDM